MTTPEAPDAPMWYDAERALGWEEGWSVGYLAAQAELEELRRLVEVLETEVNRLRYHNDRLVGLA